MKQLSAIVLTLLTFPLYAQVSSDHPINEVMDKYDIKATTISFHPNGACLISTSLDREENTQYLLLIDHYQDMDAVKIDTLETRRPNRSAFSEASPSLWFNRLQWHANSRSSCHLNARLQSTAKYLRYTLFTLCYNFVS
ncbi:MAG: hypothetical protein GVY26_09760 [Bacteroidetes bacterium]|jgi:hypothetical protein|nr:hypothetical protein [Bacteroidota bacterium]